MNVYSYWEGPVPIINAICFNSVQKIFLNNYFRLNPSNVEDYITIPEFIKSTNHTGLKSDYIRAALLYKYGGWWFDGDVLLLEDPNTLVKNEDAVIWSENKLDTSGKPNICCGIIYSKPKSDFLNNVLTCFDKNNKFTDKWTVGQDIYSEVAYLKNTTVKILDHHSFYPILPEQWFLAWKSPSDKMNIQYGLHLYTSKIRRKRNDDFNFSSHLIGLTSKEDLFDTFSDSLFCKLIKDYNII